VLAAAEEKFGNITCQSQRASADTWGHKPKQKERDVKSRE